MRILIINPFGIGDILFTTPIIRAIKENDPTSFVGYLCNKRTKPILVKNVFVDKVFEYEKDDYRNLWKTSKIECLKKFFSFLNTIKKDGFDFVIDLSLGKNYSFFCWLIGIKKRVGFNYKNRGIFLTEKIDLKCYENKHVVKYYLDLLNFLKIRPSTSNLDLFLDKTDDNFADFTLNELGIKNTELLVGVAPWGGASWGKDAKYKQLSIDTYIELINSLVEKYSAKIILFSSPEEKENCQNLINLVKYPIINFCGKTNITQFAALAKKCKLLVTNDGGPLHIAVALDVKTISIFGPVDENVYGPYPKSENHIIIKKDLDCRPCYKNFKMPRCQDQKCLNLIKSSDILDKIGGLLR
ncbi:MAG: glycosyltransferase family 9 protein [Patescibacteria group bacterium]